MLKRKCATCGKDFEAQRSTAKYCKPSCRVRASQTRAKLVLVPPGTPPTTTTPDAMPPASASASEPASKTGVLAATMAELEEIGATNTPMGQLALQHAARIQYVPDTASGTAALSRELRQVLDAARASARGGRGDAFDEIEKRRRAKWEAAGT